MSILPISEIYDTLQGEGSFTGLPVTLVRLWGCNLKCDFCDTKYATIKEDYVWMDVDEIVSYVGRKNCLISGGEPLLYDLTDLFNALQNADKSIYIETAGFAQWKMSYSNDIWVTCSPKEATVNIGKPPYFLHPTMYHSINEMKYVVTDNFTEGDIRFDLCDTIILQPESCKEVSLKRAMKIATKYDNVIVMQQMHKMWGVR